MRQFNALVPELYCSHFETSLKFYTQVLGFSVVYSRIDERFAFLDRQGAQLMIEQPIPGARAWIMGDMQPPLGKGINFEISTTDVVQLHEKCKHNQATIYLPLEEKWYAAGDNMVGNLQFIVLDPDGYMLRFAQDLGEK
ncbi:MAG: bleomycin resistance protein [Candidatus Berkiella sp.]